MAKISIIDLEVFYSVGVTAEERALPQRLLISLEMQTDFRLAAASDKLEHTINYFDVAQQLLRFGQQRGWNLIEKLAVDIADLVMAAYHPDELTVEVKKFPLPQARYVSVTVTRRRG
jgi:dihydroneopterin aldolase